MTVDAQLRTAAEAWLDDDPDERDRAELRALLNSGDGAELADRFAGRLTFGTAGLRGAVAAGPNRMNRAVVRATTAALAGWLVGLLRSAYSNASERKTIGALWDVGTFWPRAVHPFAPPCYGERAVPEIIDRVLLLMGPVAPDEAFPGQQDLADEYRLAVGCGPVLLTGYSQGAIIAPAVAAQLPADMLTGPNFALLTLACPLRRLYGRAFPAYFGKQHLEQLSQQLSANGRQRWRNVVRRSDYVGSWVFAQPAPIRNQEYLDEHLDQLCWDPVLLAPDAEPTPPPAHRHAGWWQDPRTQEIGAYLVGQLGSLPTTPSRRPAETPVS